MRVLSLFLFAGFVISAQTPPPTVDPSGVVNAAGPSSTPGVAPGSLVNIFGTNLASTLASSSSTPLSTSLSNVSVTFNNSPAPIQSISGGQISVQLPWGLAVANAQVVVTRDDGAASAPVTVPVVASAPAIYNIGGQAIAMNPDGTLAAPANAIPGFTTRPAKIGDPAGITILASGLGAVDSTIADGANSADKTRNTMLQPTVMIGGIPAQLVFSGLSAQYPGVNQLNIVIPAGTPTGGAVPLQLQLNGAVISNTVMIAVSQ